MPSGSFNICCPRDCVSRHNGGSSGASLKPLRVDSALRALSTLRGLRGAPEVPPLCRETQSLGQQMLNAPFGINGLILVLQHQRGNNELVFAYWLFLLNEQLYWRNSRISIPKNILSQDLSIFHHSILVLINFYWFFGQQKMWIRGIGGRRPVRFR